MPILANPRWELFAQELAKGKTGDESYVLAGYKQNKDNASRLKANESILARIKEIQARGALRAEVTVASVLNELEEARQLAMSIQQPAAATAAVMGKAKVKGLIVERKEVGAPGDFDRMSDDELRNWIARETSALGGGDTDGETAH